ncbi:MAG: hypothetical protein JXR46_11830 [Calditrichaceae bacterium]|nr:hypothetical protein [Calditrichaceae bacterium]MBN2709724.1 hypothetical protein [Calditrichaceae bacterium]
MKPTMFFSLAMIILGVGALVFKDMIYTNRKKIIDTGPIKAGTDTQKTKTG